MGVASPVDLTAEELDDLAWEFLGSEFAGPTYAVWPIDRRLEAFLMHHKMIRVANDGSLYGALLERVMANIAPALRAGLLT